MKKPVIYLLLASMFLAPGCALFGGLPGSEIDDPWDFFRQVGEFLVNEHTVSLLRQILDEYGGEDAQEAARILALIEKFLNQLPEEQGLDAQYIELKKMVQLDPTSEQTTAALQRVGHRVADEGLKQQKAIVENTVRETIDLDGEEAKRYRWATSVANLATQDPSILFSADNVVGILEKYLIRDGGLALCNFAISLSDMNQAAPGSVDRKRQAQELKAKIITTSTTSISPANFEKAVELAKEAVAAAKTVSKVVNGGETSLHKFRIKKSE